MSAPAIRAERDLTPLFGPRSVAVLGASEDPAKWGHLLSRRLLEGGTSATVHLVNRGGGRVLNRATVRTLAEARDANGGPLDLVAVCVPAAGYLDAVDDALDAGAGAIVAVTAGLAEMGAEGAAVEAAARDRVRAAGAVLVGPNCLGVVDTSTRLQLSFEPLPPGDVAVLSQSGNLVLDLAGLMREQGIGVSRFVSLGNQSDLGVVDLMRGCVEHEATGSVAVYAEDVLDGRGFVAAARALHAAGKPVVLLAPGRSEAAVRGAASHTGSLTSHSAVVDAACAAGAVHRVDTPVEMVDLLAALRAGRRAAGRRVAVVTDGGGHGAVAADALGAAGLEVPVLATAVGDQLRTVLWAASSVTNPVDLAGAGERDTRSYPRSVEVLLGSDEVDAVLLTGYFGGYALDATGLGGSELAAAHEMVRVVTTLDKPLAVQSIFPHSPSSQALVAGGIPVFRDVARAVRVLRGLVADGDESVDDVTVPPPAAPVSGTGYVEARALFASAGIRFPRAEQVSSEAELRAVLTDGPVGLPVVLKAMGLLHKSDAGGVVLDLRDVEAAVAAYEDLKQRLSPPAVSVEELADLGAGVELVVGSVTDPRYGPVLTVGLGGVFTEVLGDTSTALAPVGPATARRMLLSLRGAPLLHGVRGRPPVDLDALAELVAAVSRVAAEHPELAELELNPVLARADGAVALDARVVPAS